MTVSKKILPILIFFITFSLTAQKVGDIITLTADVPVNNDTSVIGISKNTDVTNNNLNYLRANFSYKIIQITDDKVELRALDFKNTSNWLSTKKSDSINKKFRLQYNNKIYTISRENFNRFNKVKSDKEKKPEKVSIGIITLPFKARFQEENLGFDTEFNFNSTVNFRVGSLLGTSFNLQLGAGIGTVGLNESNTTYIGDGEIEAQDVSTLTILSGMMLEYERIQVGLYLGWDHINNQKVFNWDSNGDAWIGFGVGFNVFDVDLGDRKDEEQTK